MSKTRERPYEDYRRCRSLEYAEKVSRLLDERYFDAIAAAFDTADVSAFVAICKNDLGLTEGLARDLWARITLPGPPTEITYW